jgi:uncharacterized membrane protein YdfJ with MMPL/SSD domain
MAPIRELGIYAACGMISSLLLNLYLLPFLLRVLNARGLKARAMHSSPWAQRWSQRALRWRKRSAAIAAALFLVGGWCIAEPNCLASKGLPACFPLSTC